MAAVLEVTQDKKEVLCLCFHESHIFWKRKLSMEIVMFTIIIRQYKKGHG